MTSQVTGYEGPSGVLGENWPPLIEKEKSSTWWWCLWVDVT